MDVERFVTRSAQIMYGMITAGACWYIPIQRVVYMVMSREGAEPMRGFLWSIPLGLGFLAFAGLVIATRHYLGMAIINRVYGGR
ncbi:hypothetical protein HY374_00405 [Candidatus Berkelbacteria bacterium]|nr:hypothetical protein [Candidatus Berkelbacteria bacterium]